MSNFSHGPRRRANSEIKLLRLELLPRGKSPCEEIGYEWSLAQPMENLSPEKAAASLKVSVWSPQSRVRKRYRTLQLRYPPEQFSQQHIEWAPSAELLGNPVARLNWFWQSGLIPIFLNSNLTEESASSEAPPVTSQTEAKLALERISEWLLHTPEL